MGLDTELNFISGLFFDYEIPKSKKYFLKYFTSNIQIQFLRYYLVFRSRRRFVQHTGLIAKIRWLQVLEARFLKLENEYNIAKENFDYDKIEEIESGKYKL